MVTLEGTHSFLKDGVPKDIDAVRKESNIAKTLACTHLPSLPSSSSTSTSNDRICLCDVGKGPDDKNNEDFL